MKHHILSLALLLMLICLPAWAETAGPDAFPTLRAGWDLELLGYARDGGMLMARRDISAGTHDHLAVSRFSPEMELLWTFSLPQPAAITGMTQCIELDDGQGFAVITLPETDSLYRLFLLSPDGALLRSLTLPHETDLFIENRTRYSLLPTCILSMSPQGNGVWRFGVLDYEGHTLRTETWSSSEDSTYLFWYPFYLGGKLFVRCHVIMKSGARENLLTMGTPEDRGLAAYSIDFEDQGGTSSVELLCSPSPSRPSPLCATEDGGIVFTFQTASLELLSIHIVRLDARHQEVFHLIFDFNPDADGVYPQPYAISPESDGSFIVRGNTFPFRGSMDAMLFELSLSADGKILADKNMPVPQLSDAALQTGEDAPFTLCSDILTFGDGSATAVYEESDAGGYTYRALPIGLLEHRTSLRFKTHQRR